MTNNNEDKPQIKLNRKMRMWNKYRKVCIIAAAAVAFVIIVMVAVNAITKSGKKGTTVAESTTAAQTTEAAQQESTSAQEVTTEAPVQETTTQAAVSSTGKLTVSGSASAQEFTSKDFYSDSVFLGDSVISGIETYGYLDNVYGNVNATSGKLQDYVSQAMANKPSKVFIMVGHNDANYGTITEETLAENIIELVEAVHKSSSSTKVYVLSITPVTSSYEKKSSINVTQSYLDAANALFETNAASNNYTYIDIASAYKDSTGYLKTECTGNGINLTSTYYPFILNGIASVAK